MPTWPAFRSLLFRARVTTFSTSEVLCVWKRKEVEACASELTRCAGLGHGPVNSGSVGRACCARNHPHGHAPRPSTVSTAAAASFETGRGRQGRRSGAAWRHGSARGCVPAWGCRTFASFLPRLATLTTSRHSGTSACVQRGPGGFGPLQLPFLRRCTAAARCVTTRLPACLCRCAQPGAGKHAVVA